jgi:hypothetical protein
MFMNNFKTFKDNKKSVDDKIRQLESFVMEDDKEKYFKTLVYNSDMYKYLKLSNVLNGLEGKQLEKATEVEINEFTKDMNGGNSDVLKYEVLFKYLVQKISSEKEEAALKGFLARFNDVFLQEGFSYDKPASSEPVKTESQMNEQLLLSKVNPAELESSEFSLKSILENIGVPGKFREHMFGRLNRGVFSLIDLRKILKLKNNQDSVNFARVFLRLNDSLHELGNAISEPLLEYYEQERSISKTYTFEPALLAKLTVGQLETLLASRSELIFSEHFLTALLSKKLELSEGFNRVKQNPAEYDAFLEKIVEALQGYKREALFNLRISSVVYARLQCQRKLGLFSIDILLHYMQTTKDTHAFFSEDLLEKIDKRHPGGMKLQKIDSYLQPATYIQPEALFEEFITAYIRQGRVEELKGVSRQLNEAWWNKVEHKARVMNGEKVDSMNLHFSEIELNIMRDQKLIRFADHNRSQFKHGETVKLTLSVKNIKNMLVNVFEINTNNYYIQEKVKLNPKLDLSGLIPSKQERLSFAHPPIHLHEETIEIPEVTQARRGLFVVELLGEGVCSRAFINKGGLTLIRTGDGARQSFNVLDEENRVCTGKGTHILLRGRVYEANEAGDILIPYHPTELVDEIAIITSEGYSDIYLLSIPAFNHSFDFSLGYNEEALFGGNQVVFILNPKLYINNGIISIELLNNVSAVITTVNNDGVTHSKLYDHLAVSEQQAILLEYFIPNKTVSVSVTLKGEVYNYLEETHKPIERTRTVAINQVRQDCRFAELYLDFDQSEGYVMHLLGENGEELVDEKVNLSLVMYHYSERFTKVLNTNSRGRILLGHLPGVLEIIASTCFKEGPSVQRSWTIHQENKYFNLPDSFDIVEGEDLYLPSFKGFAESCYSLTRTESNFDAVYGNYSASIKTENGLIYLSSLPAGFYKMTYFLLNRPHSIRITVLKGERWDKCPEFLLTPTQVLRLQNQGNYLIFDQLTVDEKELKVKVLSNQPDHVKAHLFGYNVLPNNLEKMIENMKAVTVKEFKEVFETQCNLNQYFSQKELSDELKYVIERKNKSKFAGTTLEKPSGLLQRQFNKQTAADSQNLNKGSDYKNQTENPREGVKRIPLIVHGKGDMPASYGVNLMRGAFANRGSVVANVGPDLDGNIAIDISALKEYRHALLVIEDKNNFLYERVLLKGGQKEIAKIDLRLAESRDEKKVYLHERLVHSQLSQSSLHIHDAVNTEFNIIEDLSTVYNMMKTIAGGSALEEWSFLKDWAGLTAREKLAKYNKYCSHELNLFVYFKDPAFHEEVVKPFIVNKQRKTLVDHFLLNNIEELAKCTDPAVVNSLPAWEVCLIVLALRRDRPELSRKLVALMTLKKAPMDKDDYKRRFDSVLRFNYDMKDRSDGKTMGSHAPVSTTTSVLYGQKELQVTGKRSGGGKKHGGLVQQLQSGVKNFRTMGSTFEYGERNYTSENTDANCPSFWLDLMTRDEGQVGFLSANFICGDNSNTTELLLILAVLDLPFQRGETVLKSQDNRLDIAFASNAIVFSKELQEKGTERLGLDVMVSQKFFDVHDPTETAEDGSRKLKLTANFATARVYGAKVAVTNLSETHHDVALLSEIPAGAISIKAHDYFKTTALALEPLSTKVFEFFFYFPLPGRFTCYPATVTKEGKLIASAAIPNELPVVKDLPRTGGKSLTQLISSGDQNSIMEYLKTANLLNQSEFSFYDILWMLKDKSTYMKIISILKDRLIYDQTSYSFSILHADLPTFAIYLKTKLDISSGLGICLKDFEIYHLNSKVLAVDALNLKDYNPLINPRIHNIGEFKQNILNKDMMNTYFKFLKYLFDKRWLGPVDLLNLSVYLLLQDRIQETLDLQAKLDRRHPDCHTVQIQLDYLDAYLDFYTGYPAFDKARTLCKRYLLFPNYTWRSRFIEIANQLAEVDKDPSLEPFAAEPVSKNQKEQQEEGYFECCVKEGQVSVTSRNLDRLRVAYYIVDLEVKFSMDPFMGVDNKIYGFVQPNFEEQLPVKSAAGEWVVTGFSVPSHLAMRNLTVQVASPERSVFLNHFPSALKVFAVENTSQVKVTDLQGKPIAKVYMKCFVQDRNGPSRFYKDGYTDLRGNFDYKTLNLEEDTRGKKYAILVVSEDQGSQIKIIEPSETSSMEKAPSTGVRLESQEWTLVQKEMVEQALEKKNKYAII